MASRTVAEIVARAQSSAPIKETSNSASSLLSTLVPVALYAFVFGILFLFLRRMYPRYYQPRTFVTSLPDESRTAPGKKTGLFNWIGDFWNTPDTYVLNHHTLDGYLFLRFLKISVVSCFIGCLITWPVLFPINATGGGGKKQLDILTFANVTNNYYKMFAHAGCAIIFYGYIIYMITRESIYYINLRQAYLMSPLYASRISSRTVMYTSVPAVYMNEAKLREILGAGVRRIWLATNCKELEELVSQRDKAAFKLEGAETSLITKAYSNRFKAEKKGQRQDPEEAAVGEGGSVGAHYLTAKDRPTHKLKFFGLFGKKVDSIEWSRSELKRLIPEIDALQAKHRSVDGVDKLSTAFVEFETMSQAQGAFQSLTHHQSLHMAPRFIGMTPGEVIWSNLRIKWWELVIRKLATTALVTATIIFWTIPVAVIGAISNINYLTEKVHFLRFINHIPSVILGVVTGLLPVILLAVLMALLPIYLRLMAKLGGAPTLSAVELVVQNTYFAFQIIQVFLVTTIASSAASVVQDIINDPASAATILANNLPLASNFYVSYFILQGLGVVANILLAVTGLVIYKVLSKFLDNTARKKYKRWVSLAGVGWGTLFPIYENLFVIAICYAVVAPLVLGFATIGLFFFYAAYRYNLLYVSNASIDTKGLVYPRALQHLFIGLYVAQICLIGLFAIATAASIGALGPLILMCIMLIFTALYQISLNSALDPLLKYLPKTLEAEERHLLELEAAPSEGTNGVRPVNGEAPISNEKPINGERGVEGEKTLGGEHQSGAVPRNNAKDSVMADSATADSDSGNALGPAPHKKPNLFTKWLRPDIYTDYATMRRLVPKHIAIEYSEDDEQGAFFNPAVISPTPLLWIPRDSMGLSHEAVTESGKIIPVTDEGADIDEKGKVRWNHEEVDRPPIYQPRVYY